MIGETRWRFRSVASTQDVAFELAAMGAASGTIVRADYQSAGRGRLGRSWEAPANTALTFSVLLRPEVPVHQLGSLSIQTAQMLCRVFMAMGAGNVALKWPNDVFINGRKVSGILLQTRLMPEPVAVVGIGINLNTPPQSLPPTATSLAREIDQPINPEIVLERVVSALNSMWTAWEPTLSPGQVDEINELLWLNRERVTLMDADRELTGTILGIAADGGLRMLIDGEERTVHAGEITRGPRPTALDTQP